MRKLLVGVLVGLAGTAWAFDVIPGPVATEISVTSSLSLPDGTAGAPSLRYTADVDVGLYRPGANQFGVTTNGVGRLLVNAAGEVILTDGVSLHADATENDAGKLSLVNNGDAGNGALLISTGAHAGGFSLQFMKTRDTENTAPAEAIVASADAVMELNSLAADGTGYISLARIQTAIDGTPGENDMPGRIVLSVTADGASSLTERMRISQNGAVRIGTGTLTGAPFSVMTTGATQTIADTNTVAADACGGIKRLTSGGAVTTNTTNTFTAPSAANTDCCMRLVNVGAANITLDANANFKTAGAADVVLTPDDTTEVCQVGTAWYEWTALLAL